MEGELIVYVFWALVLGAISAVSLPLGSLVGLNVRFNPRYIAIFAAFGAGALIAALSVELVAPTAFALTDGGQHGGSEEARAHFFAMMVGGVLGGIVFVLLDTLVNQKGGYLRKTSTTLAFLAKRRRDSIRQVMGAVHQVPPFDALPKEMDQALISTLTPVEFKKDELIAGGDDESSAAYILLDGEVDIEITGKHGAIFGPGTLIGVLTLLVPGMTRLGTITAKSDLRCLSLTREDINQLRAVSPEFDEACRSVAGERMDRLEQHLVTQLKEAVEWSHSAATRVGVQDGSVYMRVKDMPCSAICSRFVAS